MPTLKLSPEQMDSLFQKGSMTPQQKLSSGTLDPTQTNPELFDLDEPDIKRQDEGQMFDGSGYKEQPGILEQVLLPASPIVRNFLPKEKQAEEDANIKHNQELYESQGHPVVPGVDNGPRMQDQFDDKGEKEGSAFVPPPGFGGVERAVSGGLLEAGKWILNSLDNGVVRSPEEGGSVSERFAKVLDEAVTPEQVGAIEKNFPTMPAADPLERTAQEIISVVAGGLGGEKIVAGAMKMLPEIEAGIANIVSKFTERQLAKNGGLDVVNAQKKGEMLAKSLVQEFLGSNTGATLAADPNSQALTGNTFVDNTVASGFMRLLGIGAKGVKNAFARGTGSTGVPEMTEQGMAAELFRQIDPDVSMTDKDELLGRMQVFSDVIKKNMTRENKTFGQQIVSPQQSLFYGAMDYVTNAYGYLRNSMGDDAFMDWAQKKSARMVDTIQNIKRRELGSEWVQAADANTLDRTRQALDTQASGFAGDVDTSVGAIVETPLQTLNNATHNVRSAELAVQDAQNTVDGLGQKNPLIGGIEDTRASQRFLNLEEMEEVQQKLSNQAFDRFEKSYKNYNDLYDNLVLPEHFNSEELAKLIKSEGAEADIGNLLHVSNPPPGKSFQKIGNPYKDVDGKTVDPLDSVIKGLDKKDMKWLVTEARPYLRGLIERARRDPQSAIDTTGYTNVIKWIDDQVAGNANVEAAKQAYEKHMDEWGQVMPLRDISEKAKTTINSGGIDKQMADAKKAIYDLQDQVFSGGDKSGILFDNYMKAYGTTDPEATMILVTRLADHLHDAAPKDVISLSNAVKPYLPMIKKTDEKVYNLILQTLDDVDAAHTNLGNAKQALVDTGKASQKAREDIALTAANKFIVERSGGIFSKTDDASREMNRLFNSNTDTKKLIEEATATNDPIVLEGIQKQYLNWLTNDKTFTNRAVSAGAGSGGRMVSEASLSNLNKLLDSSDKTALDVLDTVFKNKPQFASDLKLLLETVRDDVLVRSNRPQNFSSITSLDGGKARAQAASLLTTALFGRLNRTAATVGAFAKAANTAITAVEREKVMQIVPQLISDSEKLTSILDEIVANPKMSVNHIIDRAVGVKGSNVLKGAVYSATPEKKTETDQGGTDDTVDALGDPPLPEHVEKAAQKARGKFKL